MELFLVLIAISLSAMLAAFRLAMRSRAEAARLRALNHALEARVAERTRSLRQALDAAGDHTLRLAAANHVRAVFLARMNHELRTPLNAVIGFSDLMAANAGDEPLTRRQTQAVDEIRGAGGRLLGLIDRVLDLADIDAGSVSVAPERVDPQLIVRQAVEALKGEAAAFGVGLHAPGPVAGFALTADPVRLRQILLNLTGAAIRSAGSGGAVLIELRQTEAGGSIAIHDTASAPPGAGDPFQPDGVGLCRRLAQAMGGDLIVEAGPGPGRSLTLTLPGAGAAPALASPLAAARPDVLAEATVLYIEDNPSNCALMRHVMTALGPTLHLAQTGEAGLALARELRPDLILLDIQLPDVDGFQVKARLDADPMTRGIPVVAFTAGAGPGGARRGRQAGFAGWLTKPLDVPLMARTLAFVLTERMDARRAA